MAPPVFPDISKNANGLLTKDFYHLSKASFDVKIAAPNGVAVTLKGKTGKDDTLSSSIETKYSDKSTGLTLTQGWNTANSLNTKVEIPDLLAPGLKAEILTSVVPNSAKSAKVNVYFSQPNVNIRGFVNLLKGPSFNGDFTVGHNGYILGSECAYDFGKGKLSRYSSSIGYIHPAYSVGIHATKNFDVFSASYFHKVTPAVEAGAKAVYDVKATDEKKPVSVEFATKYSLDKTSFLKAKLADSGLAAFSYNQKMKQGVSLGVGVSFDALRLADPVHKIGMSVSFAR
ncbi:hypothetical protein DASC09_016670 [Saccharomycopsis crataegensis]|uniref:Mitochondrial outer membrane protein porin n=1 Tax=Saccharomycopsis crataegensis TaxID=43959 RepID=A0AAV5QIA2_9ASCO|nr:hypothetical protein DASC09_016670 [Saccharomycopsis crataegensis]